MNANDLRPVSQLSRKFGVKAILYGEPGVGKTPIALSTTPRPVMLCTETGTLSVRKMNTPAFEALTVDKIDAFFEWFSKSNESKNYDTLVIDSGSQIAEIVLGVEIEKNKDGRKAYGELSRTCMKWFDQLYFMPNKHIIMICKLTKQETGKQVIQQGGAFVVETSYQDAPYFPGQDLNVKIPHRYDEILHIGRAQVPGQPKPVIAIRTTGTPEIKARDRSGNLDELEPPHLGNIITKCMRN